MPINKLFIITLLISALPFGPAFAQTTKDAPQKEESAAIELPPLSDPILEDYDITQWASRIIPEIYTFSYENHEAVINGARGYFTEKGFSAFYNYLQRTKTLESLKTRGLSVSVSTTGIPRICTQGARGGVYQWTIEIPKIFIFKDKENRELTSPQYVILTIVRSNEGLNAKNIAIESWVNLSTKSYDNACEYTKTKEIGAILDGLPADTKSAVEKLFRLEDENKALKKQIEELKK